MIISYQYATEQKYLLRPVNCIFDHDHRHEPCTARWCEICYSTPAIYFDDHAHRWSCLSCWIRHCQ